MLESLLHQLSAMGADVFATMSILAVAAWTWLRAQPLWLTVAFAAGLKLVALGMTLGRMRTKRTAPSQRSSRLTSVAPKQPAVGVVAPSSSRHPTPAQSARILISRGLPEVEVSKQTGLARDAVSMLVAAPKSSTTRQGRPSAAGVAVPAAVGRRSERLTVGV